ncbi:MAG: tRNA pseudouridine(54/55) synthase Pus10 [Nitrososphaerales archaeon]
MVNAHNNLSLASLISKDYGLCARCLSRQLSLPRRGRTTGMKTKKYGKSNAGQCHICRGLMDSTADLLALILDSLQGYQFRTFLIGAMLPQQILEREDEVRARFKVRGRENIKSDLTRELGKLLGSTTGTVVDYLRPDVNINLDLKKREVAVRSRPIYLFGRYVKNVRGLKQKQERCGLCRGKGCGECGNTGLAGFDSVEGIILKKLVESFGCSGAKFAWVGGEDKESLVLNEGRPFFVKVVNPKARFADPGRISFEDGVRARFLKEVGSFPDRPLRFRVRVKLVVECDQNVDSASLERLRELNNASVKFIGKRKREVSKNIHELDAAKASENLLEVLMLVDSGLTIKQFVGGDGVEPNISQLLGCKATCKYFDVLDVQLLD